MPLTRGSLSDEEWQDLKRRYEDYLNPTGETPTSYFSGQFWVYQNRRARGGKVQTNPDTNR